MDLSRTTDGIWEVSFAGQLTYTTTAADILDFDKKIQANLTQLQNDASVTTPPPVTTPPVTTPPITPAKGGIIVFSGDNSATGATNPSVVGKHLNYPATLINPAEGVYNFDQIEKDIKPWADQGKQVMLRISWSGWKKWVSPNVASWTPDWVYAKGVRSITDTDGSKKPAYWDAPYLAALTEFANAFAAKYDGDPRVLCLVIPCGDGSETKPDTEKGSNILKEWQGIGYTDAVWWDTIKQIIGIYQAAFKKTPLLLLPNASFIGGTKTLNEAMVLSYAVGLNPPLWLQEDGLVPGEVLKETTWGKTTLLMEQRNAAASTTELDQDFQAALANKAKYVLVFAQNFTAANASVLAKYAAIMGK
jgi:hypothetical protein